MLLGNEDDANTPFITLEIYDGELTQAYHRLNENLLKQRMGMDKEFLRKTWNHI